MANDMTLVDDESGELIQTQDDNPQSRAMSAKAIEEIQVAYTMARRNHRNEDRARQKVLQTCANPEFAKKARYEFSIGGGKISGLSVNAAREAARCWGNIQYGFAIEYEDAERRQIRAYAIDMESNTRVEQSDSFKKAVYRKNRDQSGNELEGGYWK